MEGLHRTPHSQLTLEDLATAMRVDSAALWFGHTVNEVEVEVGEAPAEEELDNMCKLQD